MGTVAAPLPRTDSFPPDCGRRTIPSLIDARSRAGHARPFACVFTSTGGGYHDVSYRDFANAVNRCAHWLRAEVGVSRTFDTLAYLGPSDLRYEILLVAAVKTGHVLFVPSPRNNEEAFRALLDECKPATLLTTSPPVPAVATMTRIRPDMELLVLPELDSLLDPSPVEPVLFDKKWDECRWDPFVRVHTSGSTGTPKLVTLPHGSFCAADAMQMLRGNELVSRFGNMRVLSCFPPFHVAGITYNLAMPLWMDYTVVLPPTGPLTADIIHRAHVGGSVEFTMLPPSLLIDLAANPVYMDYLCNLRGVGFAGGPLPESIGSRIASQTKLVASIGTTELVTLPQVTKESSDWPYFAFDVEGGGYEFRKRDDLFELVVHRRPELDLFQPIFVAFPDLHVFHTKDLYEKHPDPTKSHLWRYRSRLDDIIVFSNGEKLNPVIMEAIVSASPVVKGCLVFGQGQFQAGMLVEPRADERSEAALMADIRPLLKQANAVTVKHGRVVEDLVILVHPDKPLARAGKGTLQRAANMKLYASEIEQAYLRFEGALASDIRRRPASMPSDAEGIRSFLSDLIRAELDSSETVKDTTDFSALGLDSLHFITLRRAINAELPPDRAIDLKCIYDHPSVRQLASALATETGRRRQPIPYDSDDETTQASWLAMDRMYKEVTASWTVGNPATEVKAKMKTRTRRRIVPDRLRSTEDGPVVPPDGGRVAWQQVLASLLININTWGLIHSFGTFHAYYASTLLRTHSSSAVACIGTAQGALMLIVSVLSGPLLDTGYFYPAAAFASLGLTSALVLLSLCSGYWQILSAHMLIGSASGILCTWNAAQIPMYFRHRRGLALGIATGGGPLGGVIYPVMFARLIDSVEFPWTIRVHAAISLATLALAFLVIRPLGARPRRQLYHMHALQDRRFALFALSVFMASTSSLVPLSLIATYSKSFGTENGVSSQVLPFVNACQLVGQLVSGWWSDHLDRNIGCESAMLLAEIVRGILGFGRTGIHTLGGDVLWLISYGFVSGFVNILPSRALQHMYPNRAIYGVRLGVLRAIAGMGFFMSMPMPSALNVTTGRFSGSTVWMGACTTASAFCLYLATLSARERRGFRSGERLEKSTSRGKKTD